MKSLVRKPLIFLLLGQLNLNATFVQRTQLCLWTSISIISWLKLKPVLACAGDYIAHIKFTVLLMPNGSDRVTSHTLQEVQPTKTIDDPEIKAWLALGTKTKKKGGGKKKKGKNCKKKRAKKKREQYLLFRTET